MEPRKLVLKIQSIKQKARVLTTSRFFYLQTAAKCDRGRNRKIQKSCYGKYQHPSVTALLLPEDRRQKFCFRKNCVQLVKNHFGTLFLTVLSQLCRLRDHHSFTALISADA